jgi:hypothetical protein
MKLFAILLVILCASGVTGAGDKDTAITENELVRRTQELYDAIVPGNQAPWKHYFADDCIFSDEKGRTMDKTRLISDITPMPTGYSGTIKLDRVHSRIYDNVAILSYDANETETIFGQNVSARYHVTDTWFRRDGNWQIIASQAHRYYEDPVVGKADSRKFIDFVGAYELAPGQTRTVVAGGDSLFVERNGKKDHYCRKHPSFSFAKVSKGESCFVTTRTGKSTRSSIVEITKTLSGVRLSTSNRSACSWRPVAMEHSLIAPKRNTGLWPVRPAGILPAVLQIGLQRSKTPLGRTDLEVCVPS